LWSLPGTLEQRAITSEPVYDSSGLMLFYSSNLRPDNGQILRVGTTNIDIPPGQDSVAISGSCVSE